MSADTDKLLHDAAARPSRSLDLAALNGRRLRRRNRRRVLGTVAAVAVLAVGVLAVTDLADVPRVDFAPAEQRPDGSVMQRLPAPEADGVTAERLPDGTPVFVTRLADEIHVLDARAPHHLEQGLEVYVAFCKDELVAWEPFYASTYDRAGYYKDGPAPGGLASYAVTLEQAEDGESLLIGPRRDAPVRAADSPVDSEPLAGDCARDRDSDEAVHHFADAAASALTPEEAAASDHTEAVLVLGWVERTTDGSRACSSDPAGLPPGEMGQMPVCSDDAPRVVPGPFAFLAGEQLQEETLYRTHGVHLMTSAQGRLRVVGVTPLLKEAHTAPPAPSSSPGSSSESTATGSGQTILVFFREQDGACTAVEPVERQVEETEAVATAALTELFKGPSDAERDRGLTSFFDEGTSGLLRSVHVDGGTAFLDLDAAFFDINNASTSCGSSMIKSSIEP